MVEKILGLVTATHTPFHSDGRLNLAGVEKQAAHLLANGVNTVFIGGSTGESSSLTVDERLQLNQRWSEVVRGTAMRVVVHVGSNCLEDARTLAAGAQAKGALAIAALSPNYFKPRGVEMLVECCAFIAAAAPAVPFYFYDIPVLTGVHLSMPRFLELAVEKIPTLAGLKFTNPDLMAYQQCLNAQGGKFDILWGLDEYLLGAISLGARGAVGSTYNFAAPIYHRLMTAFASADLATARKEQLRSVRLIETLVRYGFMGGAKAVMKMLGVDVGPARLPNNTLTPEQTGQLRQELENAGFFDWVKR